MISHHISTNPLSSQRLRCVGLITLGLFIGSLSTAKAQFWDRLTNPEMEVPIKHPAQVILKPGQKIAVREFAGNGGAELSDRFVQALSASGQIEVVDRANLESVLREQGMQAVAAITPESAVKIGQALGCGAVFTGRVNRSSVERSPMLQKSYETKNKDGSRDVHTTYYAKVVARITASVQLVDLTTGRTHSGKMIEVTKELVNDSDQGTPEYPSSDDAITQAYQDAIAQINRIIFPWNEIVKLVVYDDNHAGLKQSAAQIKVGDFESAAVTLRASLQKADPKDAKYMGKVNYNLGIALMYSGQPDEALVVLQQASQIKATDIISEATKTARQMIAMNEEQKRKEASALVLDNKPAAAPVATTGLTNPEVIEMAQAGLPDSVIIAKIKGAPQRLDASTSSLIAFKKAGVSDAVVLAITQVVPEKN